MFELSNDPHRRYNPLLDEWVLVSPHRAKRPWQGQNEAEDTSSNQPYDETCYLCPGNMRINGERNEKYQSTYVFANDFAALKSNTPPAEQQDGLFTSQSIQGESHVICFSPDHSKSMAQLSENEIVAVIKTWQDLLEKLSAKYPWVQIFENKGAVMGCSNPHPHGQVWAQSQVPSLALRTGKQLLQYYAKEQRALLLDYAEQELACDERVVCANKDWVVVVPYWAAWPFETLLLPRFPVQHLHDLTVLQTNTLAAILSQITSKYDNLFNTSFPYSMGWHGQVFDGEEHPEWTLHGHFYPPLLRSATVKKFMVGYEMLGEPQRDITPEQAAELLKNQSSTHYRMAREMR
ncbi:MAG: UDP-glucose--hexose-1-phosphate uridylyltransferase [Glaciecola sp.]|jgi:UDPglucose--hexose-1-phosphate uridylyltransferase|nr:UDP-glucose--hexose-1-phosphate uridylyltransferase [Glaciecola sp.]MDG1815489.1 UDP-glucose--hexose-1-phosphate uridylyltransferase [Glaciecola sp.]MDG2099904.1 UDP-glucose--hexose-1-phosphate uridylyltransferase [Glaciecola sp.]